MAVKRYDNRLGIKGWLWAGKYPLERYFYSLHRLTGLGILLFLLLHLVETSYRIYGKGPWEATMAFFDKPLFLSLEYVVFAALIFHGLNGLRLILEEMGYLLGKPGRPVFPYVSSRQRQRPVIWVIGLIIVGLLLITAWDMFLT